MSRHYHPLLISFTVCVGTLVFVCGFVLTLIGALGFSDKYHKVRDYTNSTCLVKSRDYKTYTCSTKYSTYICYAPIWDVFYGENQTIFAQVEVDDRYSTVHEAFHEGKRYEIDKCYSCWYDTKHPTQAQWIKPTVTPQTILLSCGTASFCICLLFVFITYRLIKRLKK